MARYARLDRGVLFPDIFLFLFLFLEIDFKKIARRDFSILERIYFHFLELQKNREIIKEYGSLRSPGPRDYTLKINGCIL
jgi:hypothetical protein